MNYVSAASTSHFTDEEMTLRVVNYSSKIEELEGAGVLEPRFKPQSFHVVCEY